MPVYACRGESAGASPLDSSRQDVSRGAEGRGCIMTLTSRAATLMREDARHYPALTGLRGWAALWVFLYHAWVFATPRQITVELGDFVLNLTPFLSIGGAGVSIFFVLSGFLLGLPFAEWQAGLRGRPALGRYLFRRVARVFPAYYAQLAVLLIVAYFSGGPGISDGPALLRHLLMLFMLPPLGTQALNGVWWTLPIEFSFYLVLPILAFLLRPARWWMLLAGGLMLMVTWRRYAVIWLADASIPERLLASYQLPGSMDMFALGMLSALLYVNRERVPAWILAPAASSRMAWLALVLLVAAIYWLHADGAQYWAVNPIFFLWTPALSLATAALILSGARENRLVVTLFGNRFMVFAGLCSYSVYLWHVPLLSWICNMQIFQTMQGYRLPWLLLVSLPLTLAVASLSYVLVERPFIRMHRTDRAAS